MAFNICINMVNELEGPISVWRSTGAQNKYDSDVALIKRI